MVSFADSLFPRHEPSLGHRLLWGTLLVVGLVVAGFGVYAQYAKGSHTRYAWLSPIGLSVVALAQTIGSRRRGIFVVLLFLGLILVSTGLGFAWYAFHSRAAL
jgi:hypothetical protein